MINVSLRFTNDPSALAELLPGTRLIFLPREGSCFINVPRVGGRLEATQFVHFSEELRIGRIRGLEIGLNGEGVESILRLLSAVSGFAFERIGPKQAAPDFIEYEVVEVREEDSKALETLREMLPEPSAEAVDRVYRRVVERFEEDEK